MRDRTFGLLFVALLAGCAVSAPAERTSTKADAIIAGEPSGDDQNAVVLLVHAGAGHQTCTATMIADDLLVTARHCVGARGPSGAVEDWSPGDLHVFVGTDAWSTLRADETRYVASGRTIVSPESRSFYPDVAFVVLDRPLATPIAAVRIDGGTSVGERLDVVGYGLDESGARPAARMQRTGLEVYAIGPARSRIGEPLAEGELVFGEAACSGDSGGPAFSSSTGALVGIASRVGNGTTPDASAPAAFCIGGGTDDVYTDLSPVAATLSRAFAAAGASPRLEQGGPPRASGLTSTPLPATSPPQASAPPRSDGCHASRARASGSSTAILVALGLVRLLDRRRTRSRV